MNRTHFKIRIIALLMMLSALICGCAKSQMPSCTPLTVTFLKVGKADAIIALSGSHALIIDAGEEDDGQEVVDFLQKHAVQEVEAMIITHYDQDHVGGADTVLEQLPVKTVYAPDYEGIHQEYRDFLVAAEAASVPIQRLTEPVSFRFGDAEVLIEPPASYEIEDTVVDFDNNFSLITTIQHGENRLVLMGDAEKQRIREWLSGDSVQPCDFLKVPHHGVYNQALEELFKTLSPEDAVICSSGKHPADSKTLEALKQYCPRIFETKDGNITLISDGNKLEVQQKIKR